MNAKEAVRVARHRVVEDFLTAVIPQLTVGERQAALDAAQVASGRAFRELSLHLADHPDALTSGNPACPPAVIRLAHVLYDAGYVQVVRPPCSDCGRVLRRLPGYGPNGRLCGNCAQRKYVGECSRCGRADVRIAARRPEGPICHRCYRVDPEVVETCAGCGRLRMPVTRQDDGSPLCQGCWTPPSHRCELCGVEAQAVTLGSGGAVCRTCYERERRPRRLCNQCGRVRPISIRSVDGGPEICATCNKGPEQKCELCGDIRPCRRLGAQRTWACARCRPRTVDVCVRCKRRRAVHARWPLGPVCTTCYSAVLDQPGRCGACGTRAPLIGRGETGDALCGPCSGRPAHLCQRCGRAGRRYADGACARCILTDRVTQLIGTDETVPRQLRPLFEGLITDQNPRSLILWISRSPNARLLADLAADGEPLTHDRLDGLPPSRYELYVRQMLVHTGVLPVRDEDINRIPAWLEPQLAGRPNWHVNLVRPFVYWHLLRRARRRNVQRRYPASAQKHLRRWITLALNLLAWMGERDLTLEGLTQHHLDDWLIEGRGRRHDIQYFLKWLRNRGLARELDVPSTPRTEPALLMSDTQRWELLRVCLNDESMPLDVRGAGALVLLYGMRLSRVRNLTDDHLTHRGKYAYLTIGRQPVLLPPRLAQILNQLPDGRRSRSRLDKTVPGTSWLFPGLNPGLPVNGSYLQSKLRRHGIPSGHARGAALASLASELPASVIADLFGMHISTATRWTKLASRDWGDYLHARATPH